MFEALENNFDKKYTSWSTPEGGLYTWLEVAPEIDLKKIQLESEKLEVSYDLGTNFSPDGSEKNSCARLCFSGCSNEEIITGISILSNLIHKD